MEGRFVYTLEAILARDTALQDEVISFTHARLIQLPQGVRMIPMVGELLQELEIKYLGGTNIVFPDRQQFPESLFHPTFERLLSSVDQFARHLSHHGLITYVEATFTGGYGGHATMLWEHGKRIEPPGDDINMILKRLGVVCCPGIDEFDTVGLGRFRSTSRWFEADAD